MTKENREKAALPKDHHLDACVIAAGIREPVLKTDIVYVKRCVPDGDFQKTKGVRSEQPVTTGKIMGFRKFDKVMYMGKEYLIKGRMSTGYAVLMDIYGSKAVFTGAPKGYKIPKLSRCRRLEARNSWITMTEAAIPGTS